MTNEEKQPEIEFTACDTALTLVSSELKRVLTTSPGVVRKYTSHLAAGTGKLIRAASLLASAENGDGLVHMNAVRAAVSIELIHLATLVHDDVIDDADVRRGEKTLQKMYGKRTAVICGDYLFCAALKVMSSATGREEYIDLEVPDYMSRVCRGELRQDTESDSPDLSVIRYLRIISGKTAALFEAAFYAGAMLNKEGAATLAKYRRLGRYIGMIFQMTDDCLDFEATGERMKKPVQSDFERGVVTLPLIHAFRNLAGLREKAFLGQLTRDLINEAVEKTGGIQYTRTVSEKYYEKAAEIIRTLEISGAKRSRLMSILGKANGTC